MIQLKKLVYKLIKNKIKVACAESCTGGMLSSSITSVSGSSKIFNIGLVTYSNQAKIKLLKVPKKLLQNTALLVCNVAYQWLVILKK